MSEERELKFPDVELSALRESLESLEAERIAASNFEDNWIYDRSRDLESRGCVLRLRIDGRGAVISFKGARRSGEEGVAVREEHETRIEDPEEMRSILQALGYSVVSRYQKMRETWRLGGVTIALDHTPIGDFAEFEGSGCLTVAKRCGLLPEKAERRSYVRLWEDHRETTPDAPDFMLFDEE